MHPRSQLYYLKIAYRGGGSKSRVQGRRDPPSLVAVRFTSPFAVPSSYPSPHTHIPFRIVYSTTQRQKDSRIHCQHPPAPNTYLCAHICLYNLNNFRVSSYTFTSPTHSFSSSTLPLQLSRRISTAASASFTLAYKSQLPRTHTHTRHGQGTGQELVLLTPPPPTLTLSHTHIYTYIHSVPRDDVHSHAGQRHGDRHELLRR